MRASYIFSYSISNVIPNISTKNMPSHCVASIYTSYKATNNQQDSMSKNGVLKLKVIQCQKPFYNYKVYCLSSYDHQNKSSTFPQVGLLSQFFIRQSLLNIVSDLTKATSLNSHAVIRSIQHNYTCTYSDSGKLYALALGYIYTKSLPLWELE